MPPLQPGQVRLREGTGKMPESEIPPVLQVPRAPSGAQVRQGELTRRPREFGRWPELQEAEKPPRSEGGAEPGGAEPAPSKRPKTKAYRKPSVPKGSDGPTSSSASRPS